MRPKSPGVSTRPRPKWCCQTRLTMLRHVSGLAGSVIQLARAARRAPSGASGGMEKRPGRDLTAMMAPGVAGGPGRRTSPRERTWMGRGLPPLGPVPVKVPEPLWTVPQ